MVFADSEDVARMGPLETFEFRPPESLVPVVTHRKVQKDEVFLNHSLVRGILVADLANLFNVNTSEDMDAGANIHRLLGKLSDASIADWNILCLTASYGLVLAHNLSTAVSV